MFFQFRFFLSNVFSVFLPSCVGESRGPLPNFSTYIEVLLTMIEPVSIIQPWVGNDFHLIIETFSIRFFMGNRKPQFSVTRLQFHLAEISNFSKAFSSFQFSSVHFYLAKIQYNTRIHIGVVGWQGSQEETRRLMKPGLPSYKEILK